MSRWLESRLPVSLSATNVQRRCTIRRWSSTLRPHHRDTRQPSLGVCVWADTIQFKLAKCWSSYRCLVWLRSVWWTIFSVSPTCPAGVGFDQRGHVDWRYRECGLRLLVTEHSARLVPDPGTAHTGRSLRLSFCWLLCSTDDCRLKHFFCSLSFSCLFPFSFFFFLCIFCGPWGIYLDHVKNLYTIWRQYVMYTINVIFRP